MRYKIEAQLATIEDPTRHIRLFFKAPSVAYITHW